MFPFLCSVLCTLVQKKNFHLWKVCTHNYYSLYIIYSFHMFSILLFSIVRGRSEYRLFDPLELLLFLLPINIWNVHCVWKPLIQGYILLLSFGECKMTHFHLWGDSRWQRDRWPISAPHCLTDHCASCLYDCACQPTNLEWCKAPQSLGKYHCLWQLMQETVMQRSCQGKRLGLGEGDVWGQKCRKHFGSKAI